MNIDVDERIRSQIENELKSGAGPRLTPWNAEHVAKLITHPLHETSANAGGVSHVAA